MRAGPVRRWNESAELTDPTYERSDQRLVDSRARSGARLSRLKSDSDSTWRHKLNRGFVARPAGVPWSAWVRKPEARPPRQIRAQTDGSPGEAERMLLLQDSHPSVSGRLS